MNPGPDWKFDPRRHALGQIDRLSAQAARLADTLDEIYRSGLFDGRPEVVDAANAAWLLGEQIFLLAIELGAATETPPPSRYTDEERDVILGHVDWIGQTAYRLKDPC